MSLILLKGLRSSGYPLSRVIILGFLRLRFEDEKSSYLTSKVRSTSTVGAQEERSLVKDLTLSLVCRHTSVVTKRQQGLDKGVDNSTYTGHGYYRY